VRRITITIEVAPIPSRPAARDLALLTPGEHARAASMAHDGARCAFVTGRSLLRRVLAPVLECAPLDVPLAAVDGAPRILGPDAPWVSVSHAGGRVVVGWTRSGRLGLDIEPLDRDVDRVRLGPRVFAPGELAEPDALEPRPFLCRWTRKEAWLKAVGVGIGLPLRDLDVTTDSPARLRAIPAGAPDGGPIERWRIGAFDPGPGHLGAWCVDVGPGVAPGEVEVAVEVVRASG